MRLHDLINEIQSIGGQTSTRKAAFDIYNILENNKLLFADCLDADVFNQIIKAFEKMAYANASEFSTTAYKDDFHKSYNLLSFYLGRVVK